MGEFGVFQNGYFRDAFIKRSILCSDAFYSGSSKLYEQGVKSAQE